MSIARRTSAQWVIGLDFDNTIVSYDSAFYRVALEQKLIVADALLVNPGKKVIRDTIRQLPDGEIRWQELQSLVYGTRMQEAVLMEGLWDFVLTCRASACKVYIISHKTEFANFGDPRPSLRQAALNWMEQNNFFEETGLGFLRSDVFFGATRSEKLNHIIHLGCTHFIDDLEEVFLESTFPMMVHRILYAPQGGASASSSGITVMCTWQDITRHLFSR